MLKVGDRVLARAEMDSLLAENELLKSLIGVARAHLDVARNLPSEKDRSGYIDAAFEILDRGGRNRA